MCTGLPSEGRRVTADLLTSEYTNEGHTNRVTVTKGRSGWDVRHERDDTVVKQVTYTDWHRVERVVQVFEMGRRRVDIGPAGPRDPAL
jgi:hypothetical protein